MTRAVSFVQPWASMSAPGRLLASEYWPPHQMWQCHIVHVYGRA
jgi:hypothetical protein